MNEILKYYAEIMSSVAITVGVIFSYLQIRKISKSINIGQKANKINVLNSFTKEYDFIIIEAVECVNQKKVKTWYFRYWNLFTNEFLFFKEGLLESHIFEFWMFKMCLYYNEKPSEIPMKRINNYKTSHLKYIESGNGNYPKADSFFKELIQISDDEKDPEKIRDLVHKLIKKYKKLKQ
ncbi:MAG: hypothetical protein KAI57_00335 [Candidatus Pacebacteria bacterium]|nr:hypothetical protein [Candidatus Paceibacterota bacterium]